VNQHSPLDDELTRALREQASYAPTSLSLDGVQGRARRIRRNRLAVAGAGVAAVALAIAGPALLLDGGADRSAPEIADGSTGPSDVPTTAPTTDAPTDATTEQPTGAADSPVTPVDPDVAIPLGLDAPVGDAPSAVWAAGSVLHLANGDTIDLDEDGPPDVWSLAQLDDSIVVARYDAEDFTVPQRIEIYPSDSNGSTFYEYPSDPEGAYDATLVTNTDRSLVAYVEASGDVVALEDGGSTRTVLRSFPDGYPRVAALSGTSCTEDDCAAVVDVAPAETDSDGDGEVDGVSERFVVSAAGSPDVPGGLDVRDASAEGYLVLTDVDEFEPSTTSGLVRPDGPDVWMQTAQSVERFSPGGRYVSAFASYYDGLGSREVAILDAETGERLALFQAPDDGAAPMISWEDSDSLLVVLIEGDERALLRLGVDGIVERATDPVPSDTFGGSQVEDVQLVLGN